MIILQSFICAFWASLHLSEQKYTVLHLHMTISYLIPQFKHLYLMFTLNGVTLEKIPFYPPKFIIRISKGVIMPASSI